MNSKTMPPEAKRYVHRIWIAAIVYISPLFLKIVLPDALTEQTLVQVPLLVLPMVGMIGFFYAMQRLVVEMSDEYQRQKMAKIYQLATWLVLSITTVVGFLQFDKYVELVSLMVVPLLWFSSFGIASIWVWWRETRLDSGK